jgi:hypothetical protein
LANGSATSDKDSACGNLSCQRQISAPDLGSPEVFSAVRHRGRRSCCVGRARPCLEQVVAAVVAAITGQGRRSIGSLARVNATVPAIATTGTTTSAMPTLSQGMTIGYGVGAGQRYIGPRLRRARRPCRTDIATEHAYPVCVTQAQTPSRQQRPEQALLALNEG